MIPTLLTRKCAQRIRQTCCPRLDRTGSYFMEKSGRVYLPIGVRYLVFRNRYWRILHLAALVGGIILVFSAIIGLFAYSPLLSRYLARHYPDITYEMVKETLQKETNNGG